MKSVCVKCGRPTNQKVLAEKIINIEEQGIWWENHKFQIIECMGCEQISYRTLYNDVQMESYAYTEDGDYEDPTRQELYPKRSLQTITIKNLLNTPLNIKNIYRETIDAFNNQQLILCSAGLRAIVEGICKEKSIEKGLITNNKGETKTSKGLDGKIEGLASVGYLTKPHAQTLHDLRFLGNDAIHALSAATLDELKLAINIIEHTIENIYELQHKALKLKEAKAKRSSKP